MTRLYVHFGHPEYSDQHLCESISNILDMRTTIAMATVLDTDSYINTAQFSYNSSLEMFIFTPPSTQHSRNVDINSSISVAIWEEPSVWGTNLRGLQLWGSCERVQKLQLVDAITQYSQRFPEFGRLVQHPTDFARGVTDSRFFVIRVDRAKLLDEPRFGRRNYIELTVRS